MKSKRLRCAAPFETNNANIATNIIGALRLRLQRSQYMGSN
ncbi:MAG: hypothetical protein PHI70_01015 [Proteiniphilum sp.]|nr:hypothetical protein [Proteiniphilum sp.]